MFAMLCLGATTVSLQRNNHSSHGVRAGLDSAAGREAGFLKPLAGTGSDPAEGGHWGGHEPKKSAS